MGSGGILELVGGFFGYLMGLLGNVVKLHSVIVTLQSNTIYRPLGRVVGAVDGLGWYTSSILNLVGKNLSW